MIMELIQGQSLRSLLERERLPLPVTLDYACQALAALDYAHTFGVVHRDVSPSNMIVGEDGTLKLMDFGLAKSSQDLRLTQSGTLIGSLHYTAPEQVRGHAKIDARADIYSMGAVLFEMATGSKLFQSENPFTLMLAHVEQPPPRVLEVDPALSPALDEILMKALEKDPDKRFQSAELFRCALDNLKDSCEPWRTNSQTLERSYEEGKRAALQMHHRLNTPPQPIQTTPASRLAILHSSYLKVAAVVTFAFIFSYVWNSAFLPANGAEWTATTAQTAVFADLPIIWPSHLTPIPELIYPAAHRRSSPRASHATPGAVMVTDEHGVQHEVEPPRTNRFLRVMGHVIHPVHRTNEASQAAAAKTMNQPSN
jgi:serine/threonine protein kinase